MHPDCQAMAPRAAPKYLNRGGLLGESADHQLRAKGILVEIDGRH